MEIKFNPEALTRAEADLLFRLGGVARNRFVQGTVKGAKVETVNALDVLCASRYENAVADLKSIKDGGVEKGQFKIIKAPDSSPAEKNTDKGAAVEKSEAAPAEKEAAKPINETTMTALKRKVVELHQEAVVRGKLDEFNSKVKTKLAELKIERISKIGDEVTGKALLEFLGTLSL